MRRVNLGCGRDILPDWDNYDKYPIDGGVNFIDLEKRLPFDDNSIDYVKLSHVIEHIINREYLLRDIARVLKPGGILFLTAPYWSNTVDHHVQCLNPTFFHKFWEKPKGFMTGDTDMDLYNLLRIKRTLWFKRLFTNIARRAINFFECLVFYDFTLMLKKI